MMMSPHPPRVHFAAALDTVRKHARQPSPIDVPVSSALGRVTVGDIAAISDYPRFDMAAMDGFCLAAADSGSATADAPVTLPIVGEARAGAVAPALAAGSVCRISTGAPIPLAFDTVVPEEQTIRHGDALVLSAPYPSGRHVRRCGEDALRGDVVLGSGRVITPEIIGALASYGIISLPVARNPRLLLLSTGDELISGDSAAIGPAIHDSNAAMLEVMIRSLGFEARRTAPAADRPAEMDRLLVGADDGLLDIIISSGGVSGGAHDHVPAALQRLGARILFNGVAMRPGKPVLFAQLPGGTLFFGLPGNPVAAALGFRFLVSAAIRAMLGLPAETGVQIAHDHAAKAGLTLILKARRTARDLETDEVVALADQRSHTMRPLIDSNCWITIEEVAGAARHHLYPLSATLAS